MQSLQPSNHTKLINLGIFLGKENDIINPILLRQGYPIKHIGLKIPIPGYKPSEEAQISPAPDCGFSSNIRNCVLFLEAKGGGISDNEQFEKYRYIQDNPLNLLATRNNFEVVAKELLIDFGVLCSDIVKIMDSHGREPIPFPILHYDEAGKQLILNRFNSVEFRNKEITAIFNSPLLIPRLPLIFIPFGPNDYNENWPYLAKNLLLILMKYSLKLEKNQRLPSIDVILRKEFPILNLMSDVEFHELLTIIEKILRKIFPDEIDTNYNVSKYISFQKGKILIKRTTLRKFFENYESALNEIKKQRKLTKQKTLSEFLPKEESDKVISEDFDADLDKLLGNIFTESEDTNSS